MGVLFKFQYNNKQYFVERIENKIHYYTISNNQKDYNLNRLEIKLIDSVFEKIIPSDDRIKLFDYKYKGNTYQIYVDKKTNLYLFDPIPNNEDLIELNYLFNNMSECVNDDENKKKSDENKEFIRRILHSSIIALASAECLLISICLSKTIQYDNYWKKEEQLTWSSIEYTKSLSYEDVENTIKNAIENNPNMNDDEKQAFLSILDKEVLMEIKDYMDLNYIEEVLLTLRIEYEKEGRQRGEYYPGLNLIKYYGASNIKEVIPAIRSHEIFHSIQKNFIYSYNYNSFLIETTNTIFNEEYTNIEEHSNYVIYYRFTKALMELIGSEPLLQYQNYTSIRPIVDSLTEITGSEKDAIKLLNKLDVYKKLYDERYLDVTSEEDFSERIKNIKNLETEIVNQFKIYYYAKNNFDMEDDLIMNYYLNNNYEEYLKEKLNIPSNYSIRVLDNRRYFNKPLNDEDNCISITGGRRACQIYNGVCYDENGNTISKVEYHNLFDKPSEIKPDKNKIIYSEEEKQFITNIYNNKYTNYNMKLTPDGTTNFEITIDDSNHFINNNELNDNFSL